MSVSTPGKLESLRNVLSKSPDRDVLHKYLQRSNTGLLRDAVLVTLHRKWSATPPHRLTELGITTYDRASTNQGQPIAGPHAEDLLRQVWSLHLVIRSTAHLDSTPTGRGCITTRDYPLRRGTNFICHGEIQGCSVPTYPRTCEKEMQGFCVLVEHGQIFMAV